MSKAPNYIQAQVDHKIKFGHVKYWTRHQARSITRAALKDSYAELTRDVWASLYDQIDIEAVGMVRLEIATAVPMDDT